MADCTAPRHNTESAYRYGCRCPEACDIERIRKKRARAGLSIPKRADHIGTTRRLQALAALGWTPDQLAEKLDMHPSYVKDLRQNRRTMQVNTSTAAKVADVFEQLAGTPGPSARTRAHAERQGWAPPQAWDDNALDNPAAEPTGVGAPARQRGVDLDEVRFLESFGMSRHSVAGRLGVSPESIERAEYRALEKARAAVERARAAIDAADLPADMAAPTSSRELEHAR